MYTGMWYMGASVKYQYVHKFSAQGTHTHTHTHTMHTQQVRVATCTYAHIRTGWHVRMHTYAYEIPRNAQTLQDKWAYRH
jgi:hypothetical protein